MSFCCTFVSLYGSFLSLCGTFVTVRGSSASLCGTFCDSLWYFCFLIILISPCDFVHLRNSRETVTLGVERLTEMDERSAMNGDSCKMTVKSSLSPYQRFFTMSSSKDSWVEKKSSTYISFALQWTRPPHIS